MRHVSLRALLLACAVAAAGPHASAQTAAPAGQAGNGDQTMTFKPDYFTEFQVSTALDMVYHVPGFNFSSGDDSVRGFAGAAGNVLIDGQRPAAKSGLGDSLNAITASQVDHLELIIGGAPGIDMQGYRQIVNIVRKQSDKPSLTVEFNTKFFPGDPKPSGDIAYSRNKDGKTTDLYMEFFGFIDNGTNNTKRWTYRPDFSDPAPDFTYIAQKGGGTGNQIKLDHTRPWLGGKLSFHGNYNPIDYDYDGIFTSDIVGVEHLDYKEMPSEMGLQFERPLNTVLTLDLNLLRRYDRVSQDDRYHDPNGASRYQSLAQSSEHILSAKLTWKQSDKLTYKFGAESTFNRRDNFSVYTQDSDTQAVPGDTVRVEERRAEFFTTGNWQPTAKINVEAGLKVETSTISVTPDNRSQSFVYPKPKLQIVWSPRKDLKLSWTTERVVGQLDFSDFASSVSLQTAVVKAGNATIVPQKEWQQVLSLDYTFWDKGSLNVSVLHADLQDALDHVAIVTDDGVFDARGNIGKGTRDKISTSVNLPLDKLRFKGGLLKFDYTRRTTRVIDPITHMPRVMTGMNPDDYDIILSQNLPKHRLSWGLEIDSQYNGQSFNATEYYRNKSADWMSLYGEYKTPKGLTFTLVWQNPLRRRDQQDRYSYSGLRGESPLVLQEHNVAFSKPFVILRVRKEL